MAGLRAINQWGRVILAAAMVSLASSACAQAQSTDPLVVRRDVASWLTRIHQAAQQLNYEGTFVYQRGSLVQSSRIVHYADRANGEYEQLESLDGKPRKILRHNEDVYTFVADRKLCIVGKRQNKDSFPALLTGDSRQVLAVYEPHLAGVDRVAGIDTQVIRLDPLDHLRFAYKLWADGKTGLLLRAQTLDAHGQVLEQIAFSQIKVGGSADRNMIAAGIRNTAGWTIVHPPLEPVDMAAQGWRFAPDVPGFHNIRELRRPMASRVAGAPPIQVDQAVFSDGLSAVSVFVEPVDKEHGSTNRREGQGSSGATHILVTRSGDFWITLLGEVPEVTLKQFAASVEYKAPQ